jgi:hypothetical protein
MQTNVAILEDGRSLLDAVREHTAALPKRDPEEKTTERARRAADRILNLVAVSDNLTADESEAIDRMLDAVLVRLRGSRARFERY